MFSSFSYIGFGIGVAVQPVLSRKGSSDPGAVCCILPHVILIFIAVYRNDYVTHPSNRIT